MNEQYNILYLEDVYTDAEIVQRELNRNGILREFRVVDNEADYIESLDYYCPDIILSDHSLPAFSSFKALQLLREKKIFIPFIVITATMTEELAMSIVREGADDFIMKDRLKRLPHAVINAIEKYRFEKERKLLIDNAHQIETHTVEILNRLSDKVLLATQFSGIGIWEYIFETNTFIADDTLVQLYGKTPAQFNGNPEFLMQHIHPEDRQGVDQQFESAIRTQTNFESSFRVVWPDKTLHYLKGTSVIQRDADGMANRLIGTSQDYTASKMAEQQLLTTSNALQHALNDLNKIMDSSLDIICSVDQTGRFVKVSAACKKLLGFSPEELAGKQFMDFVYPDDCEITQQAAASIMLGKDLTNFENRYIRKDGTLIPIVWSARWDVHDNLMYCVARNATEKQEVQKIVEAERLRYEELFMQATAFICILKGPTHIFQMANPDFDRLGGKIDYLGKPAIESFPEIRDQGFLEMLDSVYTTGIAFKAIEVPISLTNQRDGKISERYISFSCQAHRNIDNEVEGIFVFGTDVTEQMHIRRQIEKSELRYRTLIEQATEAIWITDTSLQYIDVNPYACHVFGYSKEEFLQLKLTDILLEEDIARGVLKIDEIRSGKTIRKEQRLKRKDNQTVVMEISSKMLDHGEVIMFGHDITERNKAEEEMKRLAKRLLMATTSAGMCVWEWDIETNLLTWDQGMYSLYNINVNDFDSLYGSWLSKLHSDDVSRVHEDLLLATKGGKDFNTEFRISWSDGSLHYIRASGIIEHDESGKRLRMIGINWETTERKLSEIRLKELNENLEKHTRDLSMTNAELEQFAYVASHDLQEPLRMVTSYLTQIENKYGKLLDEKGKQYMFFAVDGARRMRQIILDLLDFSRIGRAEENLVDVDLNDLVDEILILSKDQIADKGASFQVGKLPVIAAYESPMRQVFQNLISNALKYARTDIPCHINICAEESNGDWVFAVKDNGIGIDKEYFEKIFVIFQRLHNKDQYTGTGMGLAITKKIIDIQGGKIWLESEEGIGTTFYFSIPKAMKILSNSLN